MIKIAIVDDEDSYIQEMQEYLRKFEDETGEKFHVTVFHDGDGITNNYQANYDIILMDIQMKLVNGMTAAEEIREVDPEVIIIFITNMTQYAVRGYEVDALDYILKPVNYFAFSQKLLRAVKKLKSKEKTFISVLVKGGLYKIELDSLLFVESEGHILNYHTQKGVISNRENLSTVEPILNKHGFFQINKGCLVNLKYVDTVMDGDCIVNGEALPIARAKRKAFMEKLTEFISETIK